MSKILLLTHPDDVHAQAVEYWLKEFGADYTYFNYELFPRQAEIAYHFTRQRTNFTIDFDGQTLSLGDLTAVWLRRAGLPSPDPNLSKDVQRYAFNESKALLDNLSLLTPKAFWLSSLYAIRIADNKPYQMAQAHKVGFLIPETVFTNNPATLMGLDPEYDTLVLKPVHRSELNLTLSWPQKLLQMFSKLGKKHYFQGSQQSVQYYNSIFTPTHFLNRNQLSDVIDSLAICPVCIQEHIKPAYELRVTVVGNDVFACKIKMPDSRKGEVDWRMSNEDNEYTAYSLSKDLEYRCINLIKELGLSFGCIDLIVNHEGLVYFLECNPNGQWLWVENAIGCQISKSIATLLLQE